MNASAAKYDELANHVRREVGASDGAPDFRELIRCATLAASSHNTQPWKFHIRHNSIVIVPDFSRRTPVVDPDDSHLFKSLGCATENLVHAAAAHGFAADSRFDSDADHIVVRLTRDASVHATDLSRAITKRQSTKTAYDGAPLNATEIELLKQAGTGDGVRIVMLLSDAEKEVVVDYVTRGDRAQLMERSFRDELVSWIRFNPEEAIRKGDGLAGRTAGQPSLPRWLARPLIGRLLTAERQARTDATNIRSSAGLAVFVARGNDKVTWVEVGRSYERFALQATALDVRNAMVNQPVEVPLLRQELESWLGLAGEHALLLVRFGHGPPAPFSLRRPIDAVIVDER